jgi:hypothetical protein
MAGNYMNAPSPRLAWDRDGSILVFISTANAVTAQAAANRRVVNSEAEDFIQSVENQKSFAVIFPIPTNAVALFFAATYAVTYDTAPAWTVETSKDTTNGVDGTWTTQYLTNQTPMSVVKPNYRISSNLITLQDNSSSRDLRGIRVTSDYSYSGSSVLRLKAFQIYGEPANSATPDRLDFRSELTDAKLTPYFFDWGNVPRSSSEDRSFRIKNLSATLTATDIDLYVEALTPGVPPVDAMHTISADGGASFLPSQVIASILPGALSGVFILRRTVPSNAQVSVWSARVAADVNLWEV